MEIRNIKFKAKRLDNGEWIIGSFVVMKIPALSKTTIGIVAAGGATLHEVSYSQEEGGFIVKNSVSGGRLLTFLCAALTLFKFKVIGNKFDKKK